MKLLPGITVALMAGLIELVAALVSPIVGLVVAAVLGGVAVLAFRKLQSQSRSGWVELLVPATGVLAGAAPTLLSSKPSRVVLFTPIVAAAAAAITIAVRNADRRRCALCNRRIGSDLAFDCPRCNLLVCEAQCWSAEHLRCRLCVQNEVPIMTGDDRWWDTLLGRRSDHGSCQHCHASAKERDLRGCRRCGRPQCRQCWDFLNGSCVRCQWTIPDLPAPLARFLTASAEAGPVRVQGRRR